MVAMEWTKLGPRLDNFDASGTTPYIKDPAAAIIFPMAIPDARFGHVAAVGGTTAAPVMYIFGGAGGADMKSPMSDMWMFDIAAKKWSLVEVDVATAGAGRYDAAGAMIDGKLVVFGGNAGSTGFKKDLQSMSAVDMGL